MSLRKAKLAQRIKSPWCLWIMFAAPAITALTQTLSPEQVIWKGQNLSVLSTLFLGGVAVVLWVFYSHSTLKWDWPVVFIGILVFSLWLLQLIRSASESTTFNHTTYLVPVFLFLVLYRQFSHRDVALAGLVLGYSIVFISTISLIFGGLGMMEDGFQVSDSGESRLGPLTALFGIETRWGGPFGSVNYATPIGGLLLFIGLIQAKRAHKVTFISAGVIILLLGQARTTYVAVLIALLCLVAVTGPGFLKRGWARLSLIVISLLGICGYIALFDRTLNGRVPIWEAFGQLWLTDPYIGVGLRGVQEFVAVEAETSLSFVHDHAHSVFLDGLVRYGPIFLVCTLLVFIMTITYLYRGRDIVGGAPLALIVFIAIAGIAETIFSWAYWTVYMAAIVYTVMFLNSAKISREEDLKAVDPGD